MEKLTARQHEVCALLLSGFSAREVAEEIQISYNTARAHIRDIYTRLNVSSRVELWNATRTSSGAVCSVSTCRDT